MDMRKWLWPLAPVLCVSLVLLSANPVVALSATLYPGVPFERTITLNDGDALMYTWNADDTVSFTIRDPSGDVIKTFTGVMSFDTISVDQSGMYTLTWLNEGSSTVSLTYDISEFDVGPVKEWFEDLAMIALIVGVIIVAVVIVLVAVVVISGRKKEARPPDRVMIQSIPGKCPMCMSDVGEQYTFCPRCGARMK